MSTNRLMSCPSHHSGLGLGRFAAFAGMLAAALLMAVALLVATGCSGNPKPTEFVNPRFDFGFVERVAVLPFENLSSDRQAGARATRLLITELLATGTLDVVEPG